MALTFYMKNKTLTLIPFPKSSVEKGLLASFLFLVLFCLAHLFVTHSFNSYLEALPHVREAVRTEL